MSGPMDGDLERRETIRQSREAIRQSRRRALNERGSDPRALPVDAVRAVRCECDDPACDARLDVGTGAYECVRSASVLFLIVPDHENPETQAVVVEHRSFAVVALVGRESRRIAQARDPRTPPRGIASAA